MLVFPAKITHTRTRSEGPSATPGLNHTNVFPYSSEVRNLESNVSKAVSSGAFRGECVLVFSNFQRLPTCLGLWPLPPPAIFFFFWTVSGLNCGTRHLHCGPWALYLWPMWDLSSTTRDLTLSRCIGRQILNCCWTPRELFTFLLL